MAHRPLDPGQQQEVAPPDCSMRQGWRGKELDLGGHHHPSLQGPEVTQSGQRS